MRYHSCPISIKKEYKCRECPYFSGENKYVVKCPYCNVITQVYVPISKLFLTPESTTFYKKYINVSEGEHIKISSVVFKEHETVVNLSKVM